MEAARSIAMDTSFLMLENCHVHVDTSTQAHLLMVILIWKQAFSNIFDFVFQFFFQTKGNENKEQSCLGLYSYPVLMAADILLYK